MQSDGQPSSKSWLTDDKNSVLIASLSAIALAAGSTVFWRTRRSTPTASAVDSAQASSRFHSFPGEEPQQGEQEMDTQLVDVTQAGGSAKPSKSSRSKERRRRGKDPVKELTKAAAGNTATKKPRKQNSASQNVGDAVSQSTMVD